MSKKVSHGSGARAEAIKALSDVAALVGSTLGPGGQTVLLSKRNSGGAISVSHTKDGFNVLNGLQFVDPVNDAIHKLCLQASANSLYASGDGTTSSIVLASKFAEALSSAQFNNPQAAARQFRKEIQAAIEAIKAEAVEGKEALQKVVLTSSNGDEELTKFAMEAVSEASAYGTIIIQGDPAEKQNYRIDKEYGYQGGMGYNYYIPLAQSIHETIATGGEFALRDAFVVPYNGDLVQFTQIQNVIGEMAKSTNNQYKMLIVAYHVSDDVASALAYINRKNPGIKVFACSTTPTAEVTGPFQQLTDVAAFSGAQVIDGAMAATFSLEQAGKVKLVRVGPYKTFVMGKNEEKNWIEERAEQNKRAVDYAPSLAERQIIEARNASLTGGCVKLILGNGLFGDIPERKDRADDAIRAGQACLRSGALPGCGASYVRAGELAKVSPTVMGALRSIHEIIMTNFGETPKTSFAKGETVYISNEGITPVSDFLSAGVADSVETVCAVITNAFELGLMVANLGGYALEADQEAMEQAERLKSLLPGNM
jgi:chaperonin GroEL